MTYLIVFGGSSNVQLNNSRFEEQLSTSWLSVDFQPSGLRNDPLQFVWKLNTGDDILELALHPDMQTVSIIGSPNGMARFAIWYRSIIPTEEQLFLSHDSWEPEQEIEITAELSEAQLLTELETL